MSWPVKFEHVTRQALVLVPSERARIQDLGPFRTGRNMETDILPGSALICLAEGGSPLLDQDGQLLFAFEGNANGAANLEDFHERCLSAAGRIATRSPSIAYGRGAPEEFVVVARFDLLRYVMTEVLDRGALEAWSGQPVEDYLPPLDLETPTTDLSVLGPLCRLPMRMVATGEFGIHIWLLMDGTFLSKGREEADPLTAWRPGDDGLDGLLKRAGVDPSRRLILLSAAG